MADVRIATRRSQLAVWQASFVKGELERAHPGLDVALVALSTAGDRWLDAPLSEAGGKGLFVNELEAALLRGDADLAVHSMKDVPAQLSDGFALPVIGYREDVRDAWISPHGRLEHIRSGAVVGSSSLRRKAQILAVRPDLEVRPIRGNVDTRLAKLDAGEFDAIVLAMAGLSRLGWADRAEEAISVARCLPAAGQGALGIECLDGNERITTLLAPLLDPVAAACVTAERGVSAALGADCSLPLAAYAKLREDRFWLRALLASPDGKTLLRAEAWHRSVEAVVSAVVTDLNALGAADLLQQLSIQ